MIKSLVTQQQNYNDVGKSNYVSFFDQSGGGGAGNGCWGEHAIPRAT